MRLRVLVLAVGLLSVPMVSTSQTGIRATVYASGFTNPLGIVQDPTNRFVQFIVEQAGRIRAVRGGTLLGDFLDLRSQVSAGGERGLLGLAFSPDYSTSGRFFVNFTNLSGHTVVARFRRSSNPLVADPGSRFDLRWAPNGSPVIEQPYANHNGGHLEFSPDGHLFIGLGDGGSGSDPQHRAQNPGELLGKMLRIDIKVPDNHPSGYRVPSDNPFLSTGPPGTRPEIWSFGLRNPWRYSFDSRARGGTGAMIIGDVGQGAFEEIDYEPWDRGGQNYGWRNREGAHDHVTSLPPAFLPLTDPIAEYGRNDGASITGGYVYRGRNLGAPYLGRYFYADFITGRVWSLALTIDESGNASASDRIEHTAELGGGSVLGNVSSFGLDADGELFIVNYSGSILRVFNPAVPPDPPTGLRIVTP